MVVQLFKNIHMRTTEFVQLLEKTVNFRTNTIVNEIKSQGQCTKDVQLFLWLYSFLIVAQLVENIHMRTTGFVQLLEKTVHFGTNTIVNEINSQSQCTKDVQLFNGCTAF